MIKLTVTNRGERVVHRFGFTFLPGETKEVEVVHQRQVLALQAVRILEVVVHEQESQVEEKAKSEKPKQKPKPQQKSEK